MQQRPLILAYISFVKIKWISYDCLLLQIEEPGPAHLFVIHIVGNPKDLHVSEAQAWL